MKSLRFFVVVLFLPAALLAVPGQQTSPGQTSESQQKKDVPQQQQPGTENPDLGKHNPPTAGTSTSVKHHKKHHPKAAGTTDTTTTSQH